MLIFLYGLNQFGIVSWQEKNVKAIFLFIIFQWIEWNDYYDYKSLNHMIHVLVLDANYMYLGGFKLIMCYTCTWKRSNKDFGLWYC